MQRFRMSLAALCLLFVGPISTTASASCERVPTFIEKAQRPCANVLVVVVERTGFEHPQADALYGVTGRVTRVLRGDYADREVTIWGGGGPRFAGSPPTARSHPVGSAWAVVLRRMEDGFPPARYRFGDECEGEVAVPLGPEDPSGSALRNQMDRATSDSIQRWHGECLSGKGESCYDFACAQELGLGVRRDLTSARALYRRAFELEDSRIAK